MRGKLTWYGSTKTTRESASNERRDAAAPKRGEDGVGEVATAANEERGRGAAMRFAIVARSLWAEGTATRVERGYCVEGEGRGPRAKSQRARARENETHDNTHNTAQRHGVCCAFASY